MSVALPRARSAGLRDVVSALASIAVVVAVAAVLLYALDAVPAWVTGEPRHVRRARTIEEVERRLRTRLVVPYYFPETFAWPPARIRYAVGPPGAAALAIEDRSGHTRLFLAQKLGPGAIPERLVPDAQVLNASPVSIGSARGTLSRIVVDGEMEWEVRWEQGGRSLLVRSTGSVDELIRIARSAREAP